ncbi:MAG: 16S rRNA (guanine(527)-N(7))-methyltransferase RsmG [Clostridia bacterium]
MKEKLEKILKKYEINCNEEILNNFLLYYKLILEWNEKINLTNIVEEDETIFKHFLDCVLPYREFKENAKIVDVGSGAGFPAIPLKIVRPDLEIVMIDSLNKRINFLNDVILKLNLKKISAIHGRCDDMAKDFVFREKFDFATARAVARLNTLSEYLLPFVKVGGEMIAYKASLAEEELVEAKTALKTLGGKYEKTLSYKISEISAERNVVVISKVEKTNMLYPRDKNRPKSDPL